MFINKLKIDGKKTQISYALDADMTEKITKLTCYQERHPDFSRALGEVAPKIVRLLELPAHWIYEEETLRELELFYTEKRGLEFIAKFKIKLEQFETAIVLTSPRLASDLIFLDKLVEHAVEFINGKRAQKDWVTDVGTGEIIKEVFE